MINKHETISVVVHCDDVGVFGCEDDRMTMCYFQSVINMKSVNLLDHIDLSVL